MASSQVEIVSPQNFGCVLRDRNQRQDSVFEKSLKSQVKDHHRQLLNRVPAESSPSDENCRNRIDSWIENQHKQSNRNNRLRSPRRLRHRKDNNSNNNCSAECSKQTTRALADDKHFPKDPKNLPALPPRGKISRKEKTGNTKGASSLVQIWEARLNGFHDGNKTSQSQSQSTISSGQSNSGVTVLDNSSSAPSVTGDSESSADEREDSRISNVDATENESKSTEIDSGISSSDGSRSVSDSGESKWVRVADIIRRLTNEQKQASGEGRDNGLPIIRTPRHSCNSSRSSSLSDRMSEKSSLPLVTCSPRLRGRQAFSDFLMQLERERQRELDSLLERNAVSKFSHRRRLQSMLRLRSLQRCQAIHDRHRSKAKAADISRPGTGSAVMQLREKFRANAGNGAAAGQRKVPERERDTKTAKTQSSSVSTQSKEGGVLVEISANRQLSPRKVEEATLCKNGEVVNGATESKMNCFHSQETMETDLSVAKPKDRDEAIPRISSKEGEYREDSGKNDQINCFQYPFLASQEDLKAMSAEHKSDQQDQYLDRQETVFLNGWEEQETEEEQEYEDQQYYYDETYFYDWISEISRPRSYWEDLRKYRYMEVMNTASSGKEEICRLLERRTVSDFLESELREKIDRLMMSRVQSQSNRCVQEQTNNWELPEDEEEEGGEREKEKEEEEEQQQQQHQQKQQELEPEEQDRDDDSSQSSSQIFSRSPGRSWSPRDPETASTTPLHINNHPAADMELVHDLKAQIKQLQREMSELRNSIKTCMDMNSHLQQSVHRDNPLKLKCCICDETQVESLLYRCGHMCTCLKCAHELQWNSGKCPICRAQILDVVRVFVDPRN